MSTDDACSLFVQSQPGMAGSEPAYVTASGIHPIWGPSFLINRQRRDHMDEPNCSSM